MQVLISNPFGIAMIFANGSANMNQSGKGFNAK